MPQYHPAYATSGTSQRWKLRRHDCDPSDIHQSRTQKAGKGSCTGEAAREADQCYELTFARSRERFTHRDWLTFPTNSDNHKSPKSPMADVRKPNLISRSTSKIGVSSRCKWSQHDTIPDQVVHVLISNSRASTSMGSHNV